MRSSATSFRSNGSRAAAAAALLVFCAVAEIGATVLITVEEALEVAFPDAAIRRETVFLTEAQMEAAGIAADSKIDSAMATRFIAEIEGEAVGYAYLDTHRVRTLPETLIVMLETDGSVKRVEVAAFREPLDYMPGEAWYRQFDDEELDRDLSLDRDIRPITGATLTARATTEAVRRALAIHGVVTGKGSTS